MTVVLSVALCAVALVAFVITTIFAVEVTAGVLASRRRPVPAFDSAGRGTVTVLVPAHDESEGITETVRDVKRHLRPGDHLVVVADNCSDDTADRARAAGSAVIVRADPHRRGKGYALAYGLATIGSTETQSSDVVVVLDADCRLTPGSLDTLVACCAASGRPVQALYRMEQPPSSASVRVAAFAWRIRAVLRPLGAAALGWPCQLMGTGMAFPSSLVRECDFGGSHLTEDLKTGVALTLGGHAPRLCPGAEVVSSLPPSSAGLQQQRRRWIHGHLAVIGADVPALLGRALRYGDASALAVALDLTIPPLTGLVALHALGFLASLVLWLVSGSTVALVIASIGGALFAGTIGLAWIARGRDLIGWREFSAVVVHMRGVAEMLLQFGSGRRAAWIRSQRPGAIDG